MSIGIKVAIETKIPCSICENIVIIKSLLSGVVHNVSADLRQALVRSLKAIDM